MPAPSVPQAEGNTLDPAVVDPMEGARVDIPDLAAGEAVTLSWQNSAGDNFVDSAVSRDAGAITFFVPRKPYAVAAGSAVNVSYTVRGRGPSAVLSLHLLDR